MYLSVGFAAQKRNGKDVAADHLAKRLNELGYFGEWKRGSLGKKVKEIFAQHFGVSMEFIEEWKVREDIPEGFNGQIRNGLTMIGDGWRNLREDIWIKNLFENNTDNLVISDVRYVNEALAIRGRSKFPYMKDRKGIAVLCWRPGFENDKPSKSEQEVMPFVRALMKEDDGPIDSRKFPEIPFDIWLKNDGTKEQWTDKVDQYVLPYLQLVIESDRFLA